MEKHINLQKTSRIYGVIKQGATRRDVNAIKRYQELGYDEHHIQQELGVHFSVIRSFMVFNDKEFEPTDPLPTADTQFLHDKIAQLEADAAKPTVEPIKIEKKEPEVKKTKKKTKAA